jgi:hypothetical protein
MGFCHLIDYKALGKCGRQGGTTEPTQDRCSYKCSWYVGAKMCRDCIHFTKTKSIVTNSYRCKINKAKREKTDTICKFFINFGYGRPIL